MLPKSLFNRSLNIKAPWKQQGLDVAFQSFKCRRNDVYSTDNPLEGTSIPPVACSFSKVNKDFLALADEEGNILVMNTLKSGPSAVTKDWHAHSNAVFDLDWMPGENKLVTASGDQTLALWDVQAQKKVLLFSGHTSSVKSVAFQKDNKDLLISGSRDGHIMLWDKRVNMQQNGNVRFIHDIPGAHATQPGRKSMGNKSSNSSQYGVTAVSFQNQDTFASAGCADGTIKLWDMRKLSGNRGSMKCMSTFACQSKKGRSYGISDITFDQAESYLFASCLDGSVYQFDCINYKSMPVTCYRGHKVGTFYVKLSISPDDSYVMSGSSDSSAYIWPIRNTHHRGDAGVQTEGPIKLVGHTAEVTSVAWCPSDIFKVVTLSDDHTTCIWRHDGREVDATCDDADARPYGYAVKEYIKTVVLTPRKCFFTSPIKKAPSPPKVMECLTNLPSTNKMSSPSPTITSFFTKSSLKKPQTPKKVIPSPRKVGCASGLGTRGVKRKLCIEDEEDSKGDFGQFVGSKSSKLPKLDSDFLPASNDSSAANLENKERGNPLSKLFSSCSLGVASSSNSSSSRQNVLSEISPNTGDSLASASLRKDSIDQKLSENSFAKVIYNIREAHKAPSIVANFSSPTANLPDSVRDAYYKKKREKREPTKVTTSDLPSRVECLEIPKTPQSSKVNWLTQLSMKKNLEKMSCAAEESSPTQIKTPRRAATNKASTIVTPKTPRTAPKSRKK